jgi:hypothetical protein
MALTRWPVLSGLQRSFRSSRQLLSWTFARSPGARSLACERWRSLRVGFVLALVRREDDQCLSALVPLVGEGEDPDAFELAQNAP